ncbi:hypothetical protein AAG906_020103 [Vitis piasezkii]
MFQEDDKSVGMRDEPLEVLGFLKDCVFSPNGAPRFMRMVVKSLVGSTLIFSLSILNCRGCYFEDRISIALQFKNNIYKGDIDFIVKKTKTLYSKCPSLKELFFGTFPSITQLSCWAILVSRLILVLPHMIFYPVTTCWIQSFINTSDNLLSWASIAIENIMEMILPSNSNVCIGMIYVPPSLGFGVRKGKKPTIVEDLTLERYILYFLGCGNWCTTTLECCEWNVVVSSTLLASNWNWGYCLKTMSWNGSNLSEYASNIYKLTVKHFSLQLTMANTMVIGSQIDNVVFANGFKDSIDGTSICPKKYLSPRIEQSSVGSTRRSHQVSWHRS